MVEYKQIGEAAKIILAVGLNLSAIVEATYAPVRSYFWPVQCIQKQAEQPVEKIKTIEFIDDAIESERPNILDAAEAVSPPKPKEYMLNAIWTPSPNGVMDALKPEGYVIHSTESSTDQSAVSWLTKKESKVSAHFVIGRDGTVYQLLHENDKGWHCGKNGNSKYLGIELVGDSEGKYPFTDEQYKALALLTTYLHQKHRWTAEQRHTHKWVTENLDGTTHQDPEPNYKPKKLVDEERKIKGRVTLNTR